jgi:hypothetical protein
MERYKKKFKESYQLDNTKNLKQSLIEFIHHNKEDEYPFTMVLSGHKFKTKYLNIDLVTIEKIIKIL